MWMYSFPGRRGADPGGGGNGHEYRDCKKTAQATAISMWMNMPISKAIPIIIKYQDRAYPGVAVLNERSLVIPRKYPGRVHLPALAEALKGASAWKSGDERTLREYPR